MNDRDKARIVDRYRERLKTFGKDIKTLASGRLDRQRMRFEVLQQVGIRSGDSVLDLGCGFGDFYAFLLERGSQVEYVGYDICPDLVDVARQRFPGIEFEVKDIQEEGIIRRFDYVVASQVFNNRLEEDDNLEVVKDIIRQSFEASSQAVAIDMLSTYVDYREEQLYYFSPEEIFAFCKNLSKKVCLRHDYP
ncbi:MAG: class I SAM-dependent methyltransferase, partial [Dehalococcoidia bacterium]